MKPTATAVKLDGRDYVIVPREQYDRLMGLARAGEMPPLPEPDEHGNYPAVEYARASLARNIIRDRVNRGLNQKQLAALAGIRVETLCRIEMGRFSPRVATIVKIDKALKKRRQGAKRG